jgi:hydroxyacylglutathione hydrolase
MASRTKDHERGEDRTAMVIPIRLSICNVFLIQGARPILVDTGRPKDFSVIVKALRGHGVALADLSLILHTHGHWDHCGSTAKLREHTSAPIVIHRADAPMLRQGNNGVLTPRNLTARVFKPIMDLSYPGTEPTRLIEGETDLAEYGVSAKVLETPGHTAGSISILTSEREIIVGDLIMGGFLGGRLFRGRPCLHYFYEDLEILKNSIRNVLDLSPSRIHTGHGGPLDPRAVARLFGW